MEAFGTFRLIYTVLYDGAYWIIMLYMTGNCYRVNRWALFGLLFAVDLVMHITNPFAYEMIPHLISYILIYYSFILLMKDNRLNRFTAAFSMVGFLNLACNGIMAPIAVILEKGEWLNLNNESDRYYILMSVIVFTGLIITIRLGSWIREYILQISGWFKFVMFLMIPLTYIVHSIYMSMPQYDYRTNPAGFYLVLDMVTMIFVITGLIMIIIRKYKDQKRINTAVEARLDEIQDEYRELAGVENDLKTIYHELKNRIIERD